MSQALHAEAFTPNELAKAAGVAPTHVHAFVEAGEIHTIPGTRFISGAEALRCAPMLRRFAAALPPPPPRATLGDAAAAASGRLGLAGARLSALGSSLVHASLLVVAVLLTTRDVGTTVEAPPAEERARMVFLVTPGPGGGGGGGGSRAPRPAAKLERKGPQRNRLSVPEVTPKPAIVTHKDVEPPDRPTPAAAPIEPVKAEREPEPLPARVLVAPVVAAAAQARDRPGVVSGGVPGSESRGPGDGLGAGTGRGSGNGEGDGSGIGPGSGGGTGGGPYRPGSGITPPRLLREVKAEYTEEGRRRNVTGEVLLEIVVRNDGAVGDVRIVRGLGAGLDQRAVQAVRQWRFDPARRQGIPVDVLVEVAVEFTLR